MQHIYRMIEARFLLYHGDHDMIDQYPDFVEEEDEEYNLAFEADDMLWMTDALADIIWTCQYMITYTDDKDIYEYYTEKRDNCVFALGDMAEEVMMEVARSNFSKTPSHDWQKIRKITWYFPPNLVPIIEKYDEQGV